MQIEGSIVFVTGANRGLGEALMRALLERGAARVYAGARRPQMIRTLSGFDANRIVPVSFDLTSPDAIAAAAELGQEVNLLINNASTAAFKNPLEADPSAVAQEMHTNFLGTYNTIRAFLPALKENRGAVVNILSVLALSSNPFMAGYSASKAAMHSMTQALRPVLAAEGIAVHGVYPAGIDTDMIAAFELPKSDPSEVANGILDGVEAGEEDIFPDPNAQSMAQVWWTDPKAYERALAAITI